MTPANDSHRCLGALRHLCAGLGRGTRLPLAAILTLVLLAGAGGSPLAARTINWGTSVGALLYDSDGVKLDDSFSFDLGTFGSFVPDATNLSEWGLHWKPFDRATAPSSSGWNSAAGYLASSANHESDGTSSESPPLPAFTFSKDEQAYLWAYDTLTYGDGVEWALITNNASDGSSTGDWLMPDPADPLSQPLEWRISTSLSLSTRATTVVFGGLNDVQGAGDYVAPAGTFALQTHAVAVPEPGGAWLMLSVALVALGRRRRCVPSLITGRTTRALNPGRVLQTP